MLKALHGSDELIKLLIRHLKMKCGADGLLPKWNNADSMI